MSTDRDELEQGSPRYNEDRLKKYLKTGDKTQIELAQYLLDLSERGKLRSFAAFYKGDALYELTWNAPRKLTQEL